MSLEVIQPGFGVTVQDGGRYGGGSMGIPEGGAMDDFALRAANLLVGNDPTAAVLEIPGDGLVLRPDADCVVACAGPGWTLRVNGRQFPGWMAVLARAGDRVEAMAGWGRWGCLAIGGGIDVPVIAGSRSTYLRGGFGGLAGRPLQAGDLLPIGPEPLGLSAHAGRVFPAASLPRYGSPLEVRVTSAPGTARIPAEILRVFHSNGYRVSARSDRMGYMLEGAPLPLEGSAEMITTGVVPGAIQLPPGGSPVALMRDAQTTGGYPVIAVVIRADLNRLAQLQPGGEVKFTPVTIAEARQAWQARQKALDDFQNTAGEGEL